jgi:hypothetical protein
MGIIWSDPGMAGILEIGQMFEGHCGGLAMR